MEPPEQDHEPPRPGDAEAWCHQDLDHEEDEPDGDEEDFLPAGQLSEPVSPEEEPGARDAERARRAENPASGAPRPWP